MLSATEFHMFVFFRYGSSYNKETILSSWIYENNKAGLKNHNKWRNSLPQYSDSLQNIDL